MTWRQVLGGESIPPKEHAELMGFPSARRTIGPDDVIQYLEDVVAAEPNVGAGDLVEWLVQDLRLSQVDAERFVMEYLGIQ